MKAMTINPCHDPVKRCVISLGVGKKSFSDSLIRLGESLKRVRFKGDYLFWGETLPEGCPEHFDVPFGFKTYCFYVAKNLGYQHVLWMDSACVAIRSLDPIFRQIQSNGYVMFNNNYGQMMGQWCSDEALVHNRISREQALAIPELPCSVLGLDMGSNLGRQFLDQWHLIMADGVTARGTTKRVACWDDYQAIFWNKNQCISSDPRVKGHRCDQPAAGIVADRLGMQPYADELRDIHYKVKPIKNNTVILHHREFGESITPLNEIYHKVFFRVPFVETPLAKLRSLRSRLRSLKPI
jgi:hypothetical protein